MKPVWLFVSLCTVTGCAAAHPSRLTHEAPIPPLVEAQPTVEPKPQPMMPSSTTTLIDELPPEVRQALDRYVETGKAPLIDQRKAGFVRFPYGLSQPEVRCRPDALCDIELEPGEEVLDLGVADTVRWQFQPLREGPKDHRTVHVLVKPQDTIPMQTGVVIGTDRRVYRIIITSSPTAHIVNAKFYYPDELVHHFNEAQTAEQKAAAPVAAKLPDVSIEDLDQNYQIEGQAAFRPTWIASDGQRTYLKLPPGVSTSGAPALFVEQNGTPELVNYSARGDYLVVQGVPQRIVLQRGVGHDTQAVTIMRGR